MSHDINPAHLTPEGVDELLNADSDFYLAVPKYREAQFKISQSKKSPADHFVFCKEILTAAANDRDEIYDLPLRKQNEIGRCAANAFTRMKPADRVVHSDAMQRIWNGFPNVYSRELATKLYAARSTAIESEGKPTTKAGHLGRFNEYFGLAQDLGGRYGESLKALGKAVKELPELPEAQKVPQAMAIMGFRELRFFGRTNAESAYATGLYNQACKIASESALANAHNASSHFGTVRYRMATMMNLADRTPQTTENIPLLDRLLSTAIELSQKPRNVEVREENVRSLHVFLGAEEMKSTGATKALYRQKLTEYTDVLSQTLAQSQRLPKHNRWVFALGSDV